MTWRKAPQNLPFPDRRQHRRFLTKRNVFGAIGILILLFTLITIGSEMRSTPTDEYGRVYGKQLNKLPEVTPRAAMPVVTESSVPEAASADPFSLDAAAREQYLGDTRLEPATQSAPLSPAGVTIPAPRPVGQSGVRVEGGPEGVVIVRDQEKQAPVLGGGFGKP
jgi:hypothetical protein